MPDDEAMPPLIQVEDLPDDGWPGVRIVHVGDAAVYRQAHVPGAVLVEPGTLVDGRPPAPGRLPDTRRLEALFGALGLTDDLHLLVYDEEGGGWAGRFIWTLDVIGHRRWSYLDGGLPAWIATGRALQTGAGAPVAPTRVALTIDSAPIAEVDDVLAAMADDTQVIWDVRSPEEYRGEKSAARRAGHIPTAVNLDWMRLKDPSRDLRLTRHLSALLADAGITADKRVITHCQTHHRSGLSYLVGRLLQFRDIRAFHGSWAEWGNRDDTPVATGPEPGHPEPAAAP